MLDDRVQGTRLIKTLLLLAALAFTQCFAAVPSQFIARQYTEALGRAPDPTGWQFSTNAALASGCSAPMLRDIALSVFGSAEYADKGYTPEETMLTVYRAVLGREPDESGFKPAPARPSRSRPASRWTACWTR